MKYPLLSGGTPVVYHSIASDESRLLTTPKHEVIMIYLSRIPAKMFPEFVKDILVKIERHTLVDIVDGPGDEKLDLLTITPEGKRCLTQCKHTSNYHSKYKGDDLDLIASACLRKNCQKALFVTNGDLTTQAKRYIIDNEYSKGWPSGSSPEIEYLNGHRIWEKIQTNMDILNKWFGGLGQLHGLRNFKFDISVQKLPYCSTEGGEDVIETILSTLMFKTKIVEIEEEISYSYEVEGEFNIRLTRWIQFPSNIDINYLSPEEDLNYNNKPMDSLTIEVMITNNAKYSPNAIRKKVISHLLEGCLEDLPDGKWWHIIASRSTSFVFIHDINEPKQIALDTSETFVKVKNYKLCSELEYCALPEKDFEIDYEDEENSGCYTDLKYGCHIIQYFMQMVEPFDEFNHRGVQHAQWEHLKDFTFRVVTDINERIITHLTNILPVEWHSFRIDEKTLAWCFPNEIDPSEVKDVEMEMRILGFKLMRIKPEDVPHFLNNLDMSPSKIIIHNNLKSLRFPIALENRIFMISKCFPLNRKVGTDWLRELAKYKLNYEKGFGIYSLSEEELQACRNFELPYIISDVKNMRGNRMLDINAWKSPIWVTMRFREGKLQSSKDLVLELLEEFEKVFNDIQFNFS